MAISNIIRDTLYSQSSVQMFISKCRVQYDIDFTIFAYSIEFNYTTK